MTNVQAVLTSIVSVLTIIGMLWSFIIMPLRSDIESLEKKVHNMEIIQTKVDKDLQYIKMGLVEIKSILKEGD